MNSNNSPQNNISTETDDEINLWSILQILLAEKRLIIGCVVSFLIAALLYLAFTPSVYEATTLVEVRPLNSSESTEIIKSIERLLNRDTLFRAVVKKPGIQANKAWQQCLGNAIELTDQVSKLKELTTIHIEKGTYLISLSVKHSDPKLTKELATAIIQEFHKEQVSRRNSSSPSDSQAPLNPLAEFALSTTPRAQPKPERPMSLLATPVEVVEEAFVPTNPISPNSLRVVITAIILGSIAGLVLVWSQQVINHMSNQARALDCLIDGDSKDEESKAQHQNKP